MQLNEHNLIKMQSIIKEHQFEHAADYLIEHTRQGIRLSKRGGGLCQAVPFTDWRRSGSSRRN